MFRAKILWTLQNLCGDLRVKFSPILSTFSQLLLQLRILPLDDTQGRKLSALMKQVGAANISDGPGTVTFAYTKGNFVVAGQADYNATFIIQANPRLHQKQSELYVQ